MRVHVSNIGKQASKQSKILEFKCSFSFFYECVFVCVSDGEAEAAGKNPAEKKPARGAYITGLY